MEQLGLEPSFLGVLLGEGEALKQKINKWTNKVDKLLCINIIIRALRDALIERKWEETGLFQWDD